MEQLICLLVALFLGAEVAFQPEPRVIVASWRFGKSYKALALAGLALALFLFFLYVALMGSQILFIALTHFPLVTDALYGILCFLLLLAFFQLAGFLPLTHPLRRQNAGLTHKMDGGNPFILVCRGLVSMGSTLWPYGLSFWVMNLLLTLPFHHTLTLLGRDLALFFGVGFTLGLWAQVDLDGWQDKVEQVYSLLSITLTNRIYLGFISLEVILLLTLMIA